MTNIGYLATRYTLHKKMVCQNRHCPKCCRQFLRLVVE